MVCESRSDGCRLKLRVLCECNPSIQRSLYLLILAVSTTFYVQPAATFNETTCDLVEDEHYLTSYCPVMSFPCYVCG